MSKIYKLSGQVVDVFDRSIYPARIFVEKGIIQEVQRTEANVEPGFLIPGLVDSHIHIESSMLSPQQFSAVAMKHGTVATVSDPHEIANVLGEEGIRFMLHDAARSPLKFHFGVPSCVPATPFESSGAVLDSKKVAQLLKKEQFGFLAEMMNFPGVIQQDADVMKKIQAAREMGKPVDGHAPGLLGDALQQYIDAGITTEHECSTYAEAREKLERGMHILIREGSAAKNFDALYPLIDAFPDKVMLCSDDRHPDDLIRGHINLLIEKGMAYGLDIFHLLQAASVNAVKHYGLSSGLLRENDPADIVRVNDLNQFNILETYISGKCVYGSKNVGYEPKSQDLPNIMKAKPVQSSDLSIQSEDKPIRVIHAQDHELYTSWSAEKPKEGNGLVLSDAERDILKIAVLNRYRPGKPSLGFIKNFGLKRGALGSSIAHDSHNLIVVGTDDISIVRAFNHLIEQQGGIVVCGESTLEGLPLKIAGLMSDQPAGEVSRRYHELTAMAAALGCRLQAPFMTLSFMALPVIPELKLTDQGLFDVQNFQYTTLFVDA